MSSLILALIVLTALALAVETSEGPNEADMKAYFLHLEKTLDADADGIINRTEFINGFTKHDENEDGHLDQSEFSGCVREHNEALLPVSDAMFYLFDLSGTGFIEEEDLDLVFNNMDIDDSDKIEANEFKSSYAHAVGNFPGLASCSETLGNPNGHVLGSTTARIEPDTIGIHIVFEHGMGCLN